VILLGILGFGILIGGFAQLILGRQQGKTNWGIAIVAGIAGSFVGGMLASLIAGDGLKFRASGVIGSLVGALIITAIWFALDRRKVQKARAAQKASQRSGRHH